MDPTSWVFATANHPASSIPPRALRAAEQDGRGSGPKDPQGAKAIALPSSASSGVTPLLPSQGVAGSLVLVARPVDTATRRESPEEPLEVAENGRPRSSPLPRLGPFNSRWLTELDGWAGSLFCLVAKDATRSKGHRY